MNLDGIPLGCPCHSVFSPCSQEGNDSREKIKGAAIYCEQLVKRSIHGTFDRSALVCAKCFPVTGLMMDRGCCPGFLNEHWNVNGIATRRSTRYLFWVSANHPHYRGVG